MTERKDTILGITEDLVSDFVYYDRKECEDLPRGEIEAAVAAGEVTIDEIVAEFRSALVAGLDLPETVQDPNVISLAEERIRRDQEAGERAHAAGEAWAVEEFVWDRNALGFLEDGDPPSLILVTNPEEMSGITMSKETASQLYAALGDALMWGPK